jgi:hypothetical protein
MLEDVEEMQEERDYPDLFAGSDYAGGVDGRRVP